MSGPVSPTTAPCVKLHMEDPYPLNHVLQSGLDDYGCFQYLVDQNYAEQEIPYMYHPTSILNLSVRKQALRYVEILLKDTRTDINTRDGMGRTSLIQAIRSESTPLVQLLIERGADPFLRENNNLNALAAALCMLRQDYLQMILANIPSEQQDRALNEPQGHVEENLLRMAVKIGAHPIAEYLIEQGSDVNQTDSRGQTLLETIIILNSQYPLLRSAHYRILLLALSKGMSIEITYPFDKRAIVPPIPYRTPMLDPAVYRLLKIAGMDMSKCRKRGVPLLEQKTLRRKELYEPKTLKKLSRNVIRSEFSSKAHSNMFCCLAALNLPKLLGQYLVKWIDLEKEVLEAQIELCGLPSSMGFDMPIGYNQR